MSEGEKQQKEERGNPDLFVIVVSFVYVCNLQAGDVKETQSWANNPFSQL